MPAITYANFLGQKEIVARAAGFDPEGALNPGMFPFQAAVVRWACRQGQSAIWADCGLGKTIMQLEWARQVCAQTGLPVLIFTPLAVAEQTVREGQKFGIAVNVARSAADMSDGINVTNYEKLHLFTGVGSLVGGVVLDESSCLKSDSGVTKTVLVAEFAPTPFKLCCSATPAPNDYQEIGNHSEFLGIMTRTEMLSMFFVNDASDTGKWRLKKHGQEKFWRWICSWAVMFTDPAEIGFPTPGFDLPPLNIHQVTVDGGKPYDGELFARTAETLEERRAARYASLDARVAKAADICAGVDGPVLAWCDLNAESVALKRAIGGAVEITGSDSDEHKAAAMTGFTEGKVRRLVTKPSIAGWGMNWQHCSNMIFTGLSDSYEQFYQAVRRCWRFGQDKPVNVYVVTSPQEGSVVENIRRKESDARALRENMVKHMVEFMELEPERILKSVKHDTLKEAGEGWELYLDDCVDATETFESGSIDYTLFSPPFASLYTYSDSVRDMGNCKKEDEFLMHFGFLVEQLFRITRPGRLCSFHCFNIPSMKERDGVIGLKDFRGDLIYLFQSKGWIYHSEVVIWKDPLIAATRTKALGLMHQQLCKDSAMCRQGIPDYLVTMRKPGDNVVPITHKSGLTRFVGENPPAGKKNENQKKNKFSHEIWQRYASPVWTDINQTRTLNYMPARDTNDERHICPLQLDVIERCIDLWSAPGDLVLDPFNGIGSTGYVAVKNKRRYVGVELKRSYFDTAVNNLRRAERESDEESLPLLKGL